MRFRKRIFRICLVLLTLISGTRIPSNAAGGVSFQADSLEAALKLENRAEEKIRILLALSEELLNTNPGKGLLYAREALRLSEARGDRKNILSAAINLTNLYYRNGDLKQATLTGERAIDLAAELELDAEYVRASQLLGYVFDALGDYDRSTELFFSSLKTSEKLKDKKQISRSLYGIGYTCFSQNNFTRALDYYQKALVMAREMGDTTMIAGCLNNISATYGSLNDTHYIERYVREAIAINLQMNNLHWACINYGNLGSYFLERKQFDSSYHYLILAGELARSIQNAAQVAACNQRLSNYFLTTGDPVTALKWAQEALRVGQAHGLKKDIYEAMNTIRRIYLQKNEIALAYHYDTLANMMKDSLDLDANNALLSKLELQYELDKSAQEKRMAEQRRLAATILILVILIAAVVILVLLYFRFRLRSKYYRLQNEKLEAELEFKNKELASNVMSLMKKNEILSEITQQLIDLKQKAAKDETREAIDHIAGDLQRSMDVKIWEEFELRFRQVHKDFYDKLLQKYPDLSPNEQKLCAFLRLNMTNKEISELTGQSIKALETARYRLRIKFGISNSQVNLITFLSSI